MAEIILETKLVGAINGAFHVASYQRGYRWGPEEVKRLLDDVYTNGNQDYCLQPIVVKNNGNSYELIDGQQRLTTLYLIYKYMHNASGGFLDEPQFSITYETREKSQEFLTDIDMARKNENIDFWFICNAYETISDCLNTFADAMQCRRSLYSQWKQKRWRHGAPRMDLHLIQEPHSSLVALFWETI